MSLRQKLSELEKKVAPIEESPIQKVKHNIEKKEQAEQETNFLQSFAKVVEDIVEDVPKLVLVTGEFIEAESDNIKRLFNIVPNSENKLTLAIELIKSVYAHYDDITESFIKELLEIYCNISKGNTLLNKKVEEVKPVKSSSWSKKAKKN